MSTKNNTAVFPLGRVVLASAAAALVAAVVYALTFADYVFPGASASLMTQWAGMDALSRPVHPVWGGIVSCLSAGSAFGSAAVRLNLFSLACGVISAALVCALVAFFVHQSIRGEDPLKHSVRATLVAGVVAAFAFIFSTAVWQSATHLEVNMFDVALALAAFSLLVVPARWPALMAPVAFVLGAFVGVGVVESAVFVALLPVFLLALVAGSIKFERSYYVTVPLFLAALAIFAFATAKWASNAFLARPEAAASELQNFGAVAVELVRLHVHEITLWFHRSGWLCVLLCAVLPFVACAFAAGRGLNNERTWSQYLFHIAMTVCVILGFATPLAPSSLLRPWGIAPVATTTLIAVVAGYLAAYWYLLMKIEPPKAEYEKPSLEKTIGRKIAYPVGGAFVAIVVLAAVVNAFDCRRDRGAFADVCAGELVDHLGTRTWLVTDGLLDTHFRTTAAARGRELNLICIHRDMDDAYLKEFAALVKARKLTAGGADLALSIQLGVLPFLQDWFTGDRQATAKAAIYGVPDFWFMGGYKPVPENCFFGGAESIKGIDGAKARADFEAYWKRVSPYLVVDERQGSRAIRNLSDPVEALRLQLRRHAGFVANNLGVMLQDLGRDDDAFAMYELVLKTIDRDNVCALFNEFEMARVGAKAAVPHRAEIEKQLKAIVDDPNRRYLLWSLSRYYGYIRSPEIFARMGHAWARSGQTGNAIEQVRRAIDFVPSDRQAALLNLMASIYASGKQTKQSREVYEQVLSRDASNHDALMGLARLSIQEGAMSKARDFINKAVKHAGSKETAGTDWALLHLMNNDLGAARLAMQKVTDMTPRSLQAWALLAGVILQQHDQAKDEASKKKIMEELESVILPRMEKTADSPRDYFVQMTRAMVLMRKGADFRAAARDALVTASASRPDVNVAGSMILELDIALDDGEAAERHARQVLRRDRNDKLGNYVMGSLRLKEGDYATAETFLRRSATAEKPLAAAQNDLAEVLRRLQRYEEAEQFARKAVESQSDLYVAWETLGSALLDQKKNLDEAEECVKKAIRLAKDNIKQEDIRMQITLARVQIARKDLGRARGTLRTLRTRMKELSNYDRKEVEKLLKQSKM